MTEEPLFVGHIPARKADAQAGVYLYKQVGTGKIYVGSTVNSYGRHICHTSALKRGSHVNRKFQKAFDENPHFEVHFSELRDADHMTSDEKIRAVRTMEQAALDGYEDKSKLLNLSTDAFATGANRSVSEETREKIRQSMIGRYVSEETRRKRSQTLMGHKCTDETRQKIRQSRLTEESLKLSMAHLKKASEVNQRPVFIDGVYYASLTKAANSLSLPVSTTRKRIYSANEKFKGWQYAN